MFLLTFVDRSKIAENCFDFRLIQQVALVRIILGHVFQWNLEKLLDRLSNQHVVGFGVKEVHEVVVSHGKLLRNVIKRHIARLVQLSFISGLAE